MRLTAGRMIASLLVVAALCSGGVGTSGEDRFVAKDDGVVFDRKTRLEWTSRDHDRALAWEPADRHCRQLVLGQRSGWRLPEITELEALYDTHVTQPCGTHACHLDTAISLADPYVWSVTSRGAGTRFYFNFAGGHSLSPGISPTLVRRVLCVRQRTWSTIPTSLRIAPVSSFVHGDPA